MTTTQLETYVKDQFNMELYEFIKHKVEVENLYDYELAGILNVDRPFIGKLRKTFGMKNSKHLDLLIKIKESKQLFEESDISAVRSVKRSDVQPGRINLGSHLNQRNSLSARIKTEIDRRLHPCR